MRYNAVQESTINKQNLCALLKITFHMNVGTLAHLDSAINALAEINSWF